jgi:sec-independent protein translocase protein TatC
VSPALYPNERRKTRGAVLTISAMFLTGVLFGYFVIVPLTIHFLGGYSVSDQVTNQINLRSYISSISSLTLATGLIFELPVLVFFLTKIGLITPTFLRKYRKHAFIVVLILSAIITPPDVLSMVLVALPLWLLFEGSIAVSARIVKQKLAE